MFHFRVVYRIPAVPLKLRQDAHAVDSNRVRALKLKEDVN